MRYLPTLLVATFLSHFPSLLVAQENVVLSPYSCAEFLQDAKEPADGARLIRSLMMIAWAGGFAAAHDKDQVRADPKSLQLIAATVGDACRDALNRQVVEVMVLTIKQLASSGLQTRPKPAEQSQATANAFRDCDRCPEMIVISPGSFMLGSPESEIARTSDESPQLKVTITKRFAVGRFAITFDEWDTCVADGGCNGHRPSDEGWGRGRRPVINISWNDAKSYISWLSRKAGREYRLLSDAEREYVTRAGTTTPFWWGNVISTERANYDGNLVYDGGSKGTYLQKTTVVDAFAPNSWGLAQVHGNVWEWVEDCWVTPRASVPTDGSAWQAENCSQRVRRGGSWRNHPQFLRSAVRGPSAPDTRSNNIGFRVARTL